MQHRMVINEHPHPQQRKKERNSFSHSSFEHSGTYEFKTRLSITLFNLLVYEHGAALHVAQWVKRWLTDLVNRVRSPTEAKSSTLNGVPLHTAFPPIVQI